MANRTLTDTATISWDEGTPNQVKGNVVDGSITPTKLSQTYLTAAAADALFLTPAEGDALFVTPAEATAGFQPLDSDLTELAALRSVAVIHAFNFQNYR